MRVQKTIKYSLKHPAGIGKKGVCMQVFHQDLRPVVSRLQRGRSFYIAGLSGTFVFARDLYASKVSLASR